MATISLNETIHVIQTFPEYSFFYVVIVSVETDYETRSEKKDTVVFTN